MALRLSTALRNFLLEGGSFEGAFSGGRIKIFTGSQPTLADDAEAGTLLVTITDNEGAFTAEVQSSGSVDLTGGASGSVDTLTVNSIEIMGSSTPFNTSLIQTATDVVTKINANPKNKLFKASNVGGTVDVITITAKPGLGTLPNGWVVASTVTTITKTDTNMASGVNNVNGLKFGVSTDGSLVKSSTQTWSGAAVATATAGWFRLMGTVADAGASDATNKVLMRLDGNVGTSGANMNLTSTAIVTAAVQTITAFTVTQPAA